jgi:CheY-like chemotaxis protein
LLAGRKLLIADDSATIQKVIDLTFADEGVQVVSVSNGREAIDRLLEVKPDVVLADVFMPSPNGYQVCEYVKTHEQLKHIPVMLLVGSFEPFDEAEARRVGADDILTKPFQSIRRLIERVGALVSSPPVEKESPTMELPKAEKPAEEAHMDAHELEVTTADTLRLNEEELSELKAKVEHAPVEAAQVEQRGEEIMETGRQATELKHDSQADQSDVLLDLGDLDALGEASDDFVLELDDDASDAEVVTPTYEPAPAYQASRSYEPASTYEPAPSYEARAFVEPQVTEAPAYQPEVQAYHSEVHDSFADTQDVSYAIAEPEPQPEVQPATASVQAAPVQSAPASVESAVRSVAPGDLSPEMIDAIARRAVELMSDKVIREIAWEVVPDLAELLIKKQLEESKK